MHETIRNSATRYLIFALVGAAVALGLGACAKSTPEASIAAAQRYSAEGNDQAAQIELRNAIQQAPSNRTAHRLLGEALLRLGDPIAAEVALRKAQALGESADAVALGLARALLRQGQPQKVTDEFANVNVPDPVANAALHVTLGQAWLQRGKPEASAQAFAAALQQQPGNAAALLGQAMISARESKVDEALSLTESALKADAKLVEAYVFKSQLLLSKGQREPASIALDKAMAVDGNYVPARLGMASMLIDAKEYEKAKTVLSAAGPAANDPRVRFLQSVVAVRQGDLAKAKETLAGVLSAAPEYGAALALAGEVELRLNNPVLAEAHLTKAMRVQPAPMVRRLLATANLRQNRPGKAIELLQPLLQTPGTKDAGLDLLAGEAHLANGDYQRAGEYFEAAKSAGANEGAVRTRLGRLAVVEGDLARGAQELQAAATAAPQSVEPDLLLISVHLRQHDFAKALAAADAFIKKQPQNPLGFVLAGTVHALQHDQKAARQSFEAALKIKPDHVPALRGLADVDVAEGKGVEAQRRYDALLSKKPDDDQLLVAAASLQERTGRVDEAVKTLRRAIAANPAARDPAVALVSLYLRRKDAAAALSVAQEAVARTPDEMSLVMLLGMVQEAAGSNREALRTLTALVLKEPHAVEPMVRLAQLQMRQRDFDGAVKTMQRALDRAPQNESVARDLADLYTRGGKIDQALKVARDLQAKRPGSVAGLVLEGDILARARSWPQAERAYRAALKIEPESASAATKVYSVLLADGRKKQADDWMGQWITAHPSDLPMRMAAADAALRGRNFAAAIKLYEELLRLEPNQPAVLNNLAWALGEVKDPRALDVAQRAVALAPGSADILDTLGVLHLQSGDAKKGLEVLDRVRQLRPDRLDLRLHHAKALLQNGRTQEGKAELRELAAVKAEFPGKAEIPSLLARP
ncbi:MAG: Beta-barrel assembly-enhancing protease [Burkholderiaceae bacterium]|nr:Beta-barrel assembly-enhancing protease [Burkholderiaceae bacterium]